MLPFFTFLENGLQHDYLPYVHLLLCTSHPPIPTMNDPGVDGPIQEAAEDIERNPYEEVQKQEEEEEQDFLDPGYVNTLV